MTPRHIQILMLVLITAFPLLGIARGVWSIREVLLVYWAENVIIGLWHAVKMATAKGGRPGVAGRAGNLAITGFFVFHYGIFCAVHGFFIHVLTSPEVLDGGPPNLDLDRGLALPLGFFLAVAVMTVSRGYETWRQHFASGAWLTAKAEELIAQPYKHVVIVHVGIILGAFLAVALGGPAGILVLIVLGKFALDLAGVRKSAGASSKAAAAA